MRKKEVCACGAQIDRARLSLDLTTCEKCAEQIPGNILRSTDKAKVILDATLEAMAPSGIDQGNAAPRSASVGDRDGRCLKCGASFNLTKLHICST